MISQGKMDEIIPWIVTLKTHCDIYITLCYANCQDRIGSNQHRCICKSTRVRAPPAPLNHSGDPMFGQVLSGGYIRE